MFWLTKECDCSKSCDVLCFFRILDVSTIRILK